MGENDKADETVERGIESFADKAAEKEIRELTDFENAIDETLATGYLDDTLTVTDSDGVAPGAAGIGFRTDFPSC